MKGLGVREALIDRETGFLVSMGDIVTSRGRLTQLFGNSELRRRIGQAGRQRNEEHFTFCRMVKQALSVYEEVLEEGVLNQ